MPVAELLLAGVVAGVPAAHQLRTRKITWYSRCVATPGCSFNFGKLNRGFQVQVRAFVVKTDTNTFPSRFELIALLNFPGVVLSLPLNLVAPAPWHYWIPTWATVLDRKVWMALYWPVLCLPLWWMTGRGLDAFGASFSNEKYPRIRWFEAWFMVVLGSALLTVGSYVAYMADPIVDPIEDRWMYFPATMWFVFGLISLLAWFRQRRAFRERPGTPATAQ